jgi:hypothetical protein
MQLSEATFHLEGLTPLLMHNVQMADPLNEYARAVSDLTKRRKSLTPEEFAAEKAKYQFTGSLYWNAEVGLHMPGYNVFRCFVEGARMSKNGVTLEQGIVEYTPYCAIDPWTEKYDDADAVFADGHYLTTLVKPTPASTVPSTRPQFTSWALDVTFAYDDSMLDDAMLLASGQAAGRFKGLGDGRLKGYGKGRFAVTQVS